jgi:hypothetical protein
VTSYNTGTTTFITSGTASGHTFTIPAGVLTDDVVLILVMCFTTATGTITPTLTSSATTPTAIGSSPQSCSGSGIITVSSTFWIVAGASDPGATLTFGASGGTGGSYWFNVGLVSYTGASTTGVPDCQAGTALFSATAPGTTITPSATTVADGDWQVQLLGVGPPSSDNFTVPGGLTGRQAITSVTNAGLLLQIADSNASVGLGGTPIGNTTWTYGSPGSASTWATSFTVGLAPAVTGAQTAYRPVPPGRQSPMSLASPVYYPRPTPPAPSVQQPRYSPPPRPPGLMSPMTLARPPRPAQPPVTVAGVAGSVQPPPTIPPQRRRLARAYVRFTPVSTTNKPVGSVQPLATVPIRRRTLARVVAAHVYGVAYVKVPAPVQQFRTAPRRTLARAVVRGSAPFLGYVAVPAPVQQPGPAPRRRPARAYVQFTPVATVNATTPAAGAPGTIPVLQASPVSLITRRTGRVVRS